MSVTVFMILGTSVFRIFGTLYLIANVMSTLLGLYIEICIYYYFFKTTAKSMCPNIKVYINYEVMFLSFKCQLNLKLGFLCEFCFD